jgi:hypothetical protein
VVLPAAASLALAELIWRISAMSILEQEGIASLVAGMAGITTPASIARITGHHTTGLTPATTERFRKP